jgi:polysaccharide chain length determinant protein (PEP-CTERM system associated)
MSAPETDDSLSVKFSPLSIARTIWKRKGVVLASWLAVTAAVVVIVARLPAVYQAEALILVDSQKIPDKFVSSTVNSDLQDRISTISQQILSSTRLKKVIDDFSLYPAERKKLFEEELLEKMRKDIGVKLEPGYNKNRPGAFRISFQGPDPAVVAQVANRLANLFIEENLRTREVQAQGTSEFIDSQLQEAKKTLDEQEKTVSEYKLQHNGELPQQENSISSVLARLQVQLEANRDAINRVQQNRVMVENSLSTTESSLTAINAAIAVRNLQDPAVVAAMGQGQLANQVRKTPLELKRAQLDDLLKRYGPQHPEVRRMVAEVADLEASEKKDAPLPQVPVPPPSGGAPKTNPPVSPKSGTVADAMNLAQVTERISTLKSQLSLIDKELEFRKVEHDRVVQEMSSAQARLSRLPIREQEMARITRDYEMSKANYKSLLDKKLAAEMATDMEHRQKSERFTLLDAARTPGRPQKPNRELLDIAGTLAGILVGLLFAFGLELRRDVILGEWELPPHVVIMGRLPVIVMAGAVVPGSRGTAAGAPRAGAPRKFAIVGSVLVIIVGAAAAAGWYVVNHR